MDQLRTMGESDVSVENTQYRGDYCPGREDQCSSVDTFIVACIMIQSYWPESETDRASIGEKRDLCREGSFRLLILLI